MPEADSGGEDDIHLEITPEPSPAERAAIRAALRVALAASAPEDEPRPSAWAAAGRREALFGRIERTRFRWGRGLDWTTPW